MIKMQIEKSEMQEFARLVAASVVEALESKGLLGIPVQKQDKPKSKSAYAKTEALLYNYHGFKRIIHEHKLEIETLRRCGIPKKSTSIVEYTPKSGTVHGIVLEDDTVESMIANVERSVEGTVQAISLIDKAMDTLKGDPYYCILEMRYFEGRTQEDIADHLGCSQVTISKNKNRLVRELSMRLFPNQTINEMLE